MDNRKHYPQNTTWRKLAIKCRKKKERLKEWQNEKGERGLQNGKETLSGKEKKSDKNREEEKTKERKYHVKKVNRT